MTRKLYLEEENCKKFYELLDKKKELIIKALYRVHIPKKLHHEFYNYGLEGLLVSFLILNDGGITEKDFDRFAFTTIKRKLIDEIRFRNKDKSVPLDIFDNNILDSSDNSYDYLYIQLFEYVNKTLEKQELEYFNTFKKSLDIKQTAKSLNISLATAYRLHKRVKEACEKFLMT